MNCRDFLNEFEDRNTLSETATLHLNDCVDCRKINTVQTRVWQVIDGFKPVDAPKDFDFRVKARIADAKPDDFRQPLFPILRYVMGLSIVGLILAFVVFNGVYSFDNKTVPAIAENNFQPPVQRENPPTLDSPSEQLAVTSVPQSFENENKKSIVEITERKTEQPESKKQPRTSKNETLFVAFNDKRNLQERNRKDVDKNFVGSRVLSVKPAQIMTPEGFSNSPQTNQNPSNFNNVSLITAEQILSQLGIEITLEKGNRKVRKITQNSVAERSNVKVGDVIEAIDGEKLTSEPIRAKIIEGKKLTVVRGTEKVDISLRY
jgi:membrane-associated protease RseP (regulator of RpoE activity)